MTSFARTSQRQEPSLEEMAKALFAGVAAIGPDVEGVSRPAFSKIETETLGYLEDFATSHGLEVWYDEGENANFCLPGDRDAARYLVIGSHVDSVPYGGNYDGLAGVVAGLLCLLRLREAGRPDGKAVHVLAMRGEESAWFGPCYIGSKALTGRLEASELEATHRGDGRTLAQHMASLGLPIQKIGAGQALMDLSRVKAYLELHIEQGPMLIGKKLPIAVVSGIRGNIRYPQIRCMGEPGHSGAVPKAFRRDAVLAVADLLGRIDESWVTILNKGDDLVFTCGMLSTNPEKHALSRIPDEVTFSLDIRSQSVQTLAEMRELIKNEVEQVERDRKVNFDLGRELQVPPALCDTELAEALKSAMTRVGQAPFVMPSGGGHDAAVFAEAGVPTAMIFVRNSNGSHNPDEAMEIDDFLAAVDVMVEFAASA